MKENFGIGERVKSYRTKLNMSQDYVANYLGINRATYCQLEKGKRKTTVDNILKLSILFGVSANALLYGDKPETPLLSFLYEFGQLNEQDREEVMSIIKMKNNKYKAS